MDLSRFTISSSKEKINTLKIHNARLAKLRYVYITFLCAVAAAASILAGFSGRDVYMYGIIWAVAIVANTFLLVLNNYAARTYGQLRIIMVSQITIDLAAAAYVIYNQGGAEARATILFALPIIAAGLLFSVRTVYGTALLGGFAYILSVLFASDAFSKGINWDESLVQLVFYPVFFLILASLVVYLARFNEQFTREEAYDAFLSLLSHQLVHPASTAASIIDIIEHQKPGDNAKNSSYIQMLKSENRQLLFLLNNLIETASTISTTAGAEDIDVKKMLNRIAGQVAEETDRASDLVIQVPDKLIIVGNRSKLDTALRNIVHNAFRYSSEGSPIRITAEEQGKKAVINIEDSGKGMNVSVQKLAFEKYNVEALKSGEGVKGLGLGLFVTRKIIAAHKGSLEILSKENVGTRVIIKLALKRGSK